jgi:hypothetical protein
MIEPMVTDSNIVIMTLYAVQAGSEIVQVGSQVLFVKVRCSLVKHTLPERHRHRNALSTRNPIMAPGRFNP